MKPRVKFLTAVWGEAYIDRFCSLSLPSFVAPGNIPALAAACELEVVIMTRKADMATFDEYAAFRRLQATCAVRFIDVDDLVAKSSVYGVTLTLAYARPIIECGADMVNIHFVFMNADFVLADGSLRSLLKHIIEGRSIVLGPSFRAISEDVEPLLEKAVDLEGGVLTMGTRNMVRLSLPHPHRTTIAKMRNQGLFHSVRPNQFFWLHNRDAIVGRYFLIFMLSLKPERVIESINSYCDYGFIPELCPSGDEVAMGDSDDFFMLELQERDKETDMLRFGSQEIDETVKSLNEWTTREHRRAATHEIIFHSGDIPSDIGETRRKAQAFIDDLISRLGPPRPHVFHKYWVGGVKAWKAQRARHRVYKVPPELDAQTPSNIPWWVESRTSRLTKWLASLCQSADHRFIRETVSKFIEPGGSAYITGDDFILSDRLLRQLVRQRNLRIEVDYPRQRKTQGDSKVLDYFDMAIITLSGVAPGRLGQFLRQSTAKLSPGATILVILYPLERTMAVDSFELFEEFGGLAQVANMFSFGGRTIWAARRLAEWINERESKRAEGLQTPLSFILSMMALVGLVICSCVNQCIRIIPSKADRLGRVRRPFSTMIYAIRLARG